MIIEPTAGSLLYIQPVYLQEEGPLKIPQLKRLIMALDDAVVMAPSLEEAAVMLEAELVRKSKRRDKRFRSLPPADKAAKIQEDQAPPKLPDESKQTPAGEQESVPIVKDQIKSSDDESKSSPSVKNTDEVIKD